MATRRWIGGTATRSWSAVSRRKPKQRPGVPKQRKRPLSRTTKPRLSPKLSKTQPHHELAQAPAALVLQCGTHCAVGRFRREPNTFANELPWGMAQAVVI